MKNSSIEALVSSSFTKCNPGHIIKDIDVEWLVEYNNTYKFEVDVISEIDNQDTLTRLEVYINNNEIGFEGDYCIDSNDIRAMLNVEYNVSEYNSRNKIFRSSPGNFTYYVECVSEKCQDLQERYVKVHIKKILKMKL